MCLDLEGFGSSFDQDEGFLSHSEAILGDLSELRKTPEINLGVVLEHYDDVTPLFDEARHDMHILDHVVVKVVIILPRQV